MRLVVAGTERLEHEQRFREFSWRARHEQGAIVAAVFAFDANLTGEPPGDGVEEEQGLDEGLKHVHQMIASGDVMQFVREHCLELIGSERGECRSRDQYQWSQPADDHWRIDDVAHQHRDSRVDADLRFQRVEHAGPVRGGFGDADDPESPNLDPLAEQANGHEGDSDDPTPGDHRGRYETEHDRLGVEVSGR